MLDSAYSTRMNDGQSAWDTVRSALVNISGVYIGCVLGFICSMLVIALFPAAEKGLVGRFFDWAPAVATSLVAGVYSYKRFPSRVIFWVWVVPGVLLAWNVWSWQTGGMSKYDSAWDTFFGQHCGSSECLYEVFVTLPFYSGLAYSLGGLLQSRKDLKPS